MFICGQSAPRRRYQHLLTTKWHKNFEKFVIYAEKGGGVIYGHALAGSPPPWVAVVGETLPSPVGVVGLGLGGIKRDDLRFPLSPLGVGGWT